MSSFSLSPGVSVREVNLTGYVPNIASAKTGMVLRADQGPCMEAVNITNETDLVTVFGKPTAYNFQDWFKAWNFVQYASSLYVVRPMDANLQTQNAGIGISNTGNFAMSAPNFYNDVVAQNSLRTFNSVGAPLYFINKSITSTQKFAVCISSSPTTFKKQLALEYYAIANTVNGTNTVGMNGVATLVNGSQVILNGNKLANVQTVTQSSPTSGTIVFDRPVSAIDVDAFYGTPSTSAVITTNSTNFTTSFTKAGFTFKVGTVVLSNFVVTTIANNATDSTLYDVTFINNSGSATVAPVFTAGTPISSSTVYYRATTSYNPALGNFGLNAGDTMISVQPGFILEAGVQFTIPGIANTYTVASVDNVLNNVYLVSPSPSGLTSATVSAGLTFSITSPTAVDKVMIGVNLFDKVYDSGIIKQTRTLLTDKNGLAVTIVAQSLVPFSSLFNYPPNWTNGEFAVVVLRINDAGYYENFETFKVSYNPTALNSNGTNIFVENVFNNSSKALYAKIGDPTAIHPNTFNLPLAAITGGVNTIYPTTIKYGNTVYNAAGYTQGDIMEAYTMFADPEQIDINILTAHELDLNTASTIAESRKDCIAVVGPYNYSYLSVNTSNNCTQSLLDGYGTQTSSINKVFTTFGTYSAFYGNMKYQYDKFNNVNRWINVEGDIAGLYAQTDNTNDPWWAPAGTSRGIIKNAIKLAFNPTKQNRDDLYVNGINPIMSIPGEGSAVVWGQKTATAMPSAMDRVNVRRLLIFLEKSIAIASNIGLFEFNDVFTRTRLFNIIDPFLRSVKARRGLYNYKIVCDDTNNTPSVIDQNGLVIDIYLQPEKVAEFIKVTAAVVPTGATFSEYVGTF